MVVVRVAQQALREIVLVDRRRHAADPQLPGHEHHRVGGLAEVEHDRQRRVRRARIRRHERDPDGRAGEVTGIRPDRRELLQVRPVAADDECPALLVLGAVGAAAGVQDALEMLRLERAIGEPADDPARP